MAKPPSIEDVLASLTGGKSSTYTINTEKGVFQADGEDDHRRAMEMMAAVEQLARARSEASPPSTNAKTSAAALAPPSGYSVQQAIELWESLGHGALATSTIQAKRSIIKSFAEHFGPNRPIAEVRRSDVSAWHVHLANNQKNSGVTRNNKAGHLAAFFDFIKGQGHYHEALENPAEGTAELSRNERKKRAKSHGWIPFTTEQLKLMFSPESIERTEEQHTRRGLMIGLYTGARVSEVAKLEVKDFKVVDDVHCIHWQGDFKTECTQRVVPIHPDLIRLGLLDWVEQQRKRRQPRLFPDVKIDGHNQGGAISKGTSYLLARLDIRVPKGVKNRIGVEAR